MRGANGDVRTEPRTSRDRDGRRVRSRTAATGTGRDRGGGSHPDRGGRRRSRARRADGDAGAGGARLSRMVLGLSDRSPRSEEHTSELQSLMRISYAVFCLKKNTSTNIPLNKKTHT